MELRKRHGIEKTELTDELTGRGLWRMTNFSAHDVHPYYDINPWSPDGSKIVFSSADPERLEDAGPFMVTPHGHIFVMDAETGEIQWIKGDVPFQSHVGCMPIWTADGTAIIYGRHRSLQSKDAQPKMHILDLASGRETVVTGVEARQISPDGSVVLCQKPDGVELYFMEDGRREFILPAERFVEQMPHYDHSYAEKPVIANLKWSPDGSRFLIRFNFTPGEYMKSLFVASADGTELRRLEGVGHKFHHHSWHPDGNRIIYGDLDEKGEFKLFFIDADGGNRRRVSETRLAGHPSVSPDGRTIVTDNYAGEFPDESKGDVFGDCLLLVDAATGEVEQLAGIRGKMKWLHAHPSWSRDGSQILYHSDHTGMSQIYVMPIDQ